MINLANLHKMFDQSKNCRFSVSLKKKKNAIHIVYTHIPILHTLCTNVFHTFIDTLCVTVYWCEHSIMGIIYKGSMPCCVLNSWKSSGMVSLQRYFKFDQMMFS